MIYNSYTWKKDLYRRKQMIIKYNTVEALHNNFDSVYTILEKAVFYTAFIIRKLIDCDMLSDEADQFTLHAKQITPNKLIVKTHRWLVEDSHNWDSIDSTIVKGKDVCNWLMHSYIFSFEFMENGPVTSFYVSSDYDRNKVLYKLSLQDWISYIIFVANDDIISMSMKYNERIQDYKSIRKKRGI